MEARKTVLYEELATAVQAYLNCKDKMAQYQNEVDGPLPRPSAQGYYENAQVWSGRWAERIQYLCEHFMPSGSGIDNGTVLDLAHSHGDRLVFVAPFHHMNDTGMYDGWTDHVITVIPALQGQFHLRISGRDRNQIKEYLHETYDWALRTRLEWQNGENDGQWIREQKASL